MVGANRPVKRVNTEKSVSQRRPVSALQSTVAAAGITPELSLFKIRSLFLLFYGTLGSCLPFFPVYYRSIGIEQEFIGLLGSITPAITFIVSPLWGALADATGAYRSIMLSTFLLSTVGRCAMAHHAVTSNMLLMGLLVAGTAVLNAPVKPLMDSAIMSSLVDKGDYGKSRLFGQLGFGIGSFAVGPLLASNMNHIFSLHAALAVPTALLMSTLGNNIQDNKGTPTISSSSSERDVKKAKRQKVRIAAAMKRALWHPDVMFFFLAVFIVGLSSGIIENFAYVRIAEVGGKGSDLGLCRLASSLAGGPMFWLSGAINKALGVDAILMLTFVSYVLRFVIYANIKKPLQALPAEILRGVTFATFWACSTYHVYQVAPTGATATMLGLLNGVYGGVGQSSGAVLGGYLSQRFGIQKAFMLASRGQMAFAAAYGAYLFKKRRW